MLPMLSDECRVGVPVHMANKFRLSQKRPVWEGTLLEFNKWGLKSVCTIWKVNVRIWYLAGSWLLKGIKDRYYLAVNLTRENFGNTK